MNKNIKFMMVAAAAIAMIGCAKEGGENNGTKAPADNTVGTIATVTISNKVAMGTRAAGLPEDFVANGDETTLEQLDLFVFDANKQLEQIISFDETDLTPSAGVYPAKSFETTNGLHTLVVLANQPAALVTAVAGLKTLKESDKGAQDELDPTMYSEFLTITTLSGWDSQTDFVAAVQGATSGLFMTNVIDTREAISSVYGNDFNSFDYTFEVPTDATPEPEENDIKINLGRAFAKATVDWDDVQPTQNVSNLKPGAEEAQVKVGKIEDLEFVLLQNPTSSYAPMHIDNGTYKAALHDVSLYSATNYYNWTYNPLPGEWKTADAADANQVYIPENTNPDFEGMRTAFGFKGNFTPTVVVKNTLAGNATTGNYVINDAFAENSTFYRIKIKAEIEGIVPAAAVGTWVDIYFDEKPDYQVPAQQAAIMKALGYTAPQAMSSSTVKPVEGTHYEIYAYEDGASYWYLGLEASDKASALKYDVARNEFFWVDITTIAGLGEPTLEDAIPEPTTPLIVNVDVKATITVTDWVPVNIQGNI
jgi:hypothetical protein